jgi:hypothetical protein
MTNINIQDASYAQSLYQRAVLGWKDRAGDAVQRTYWLGEVQL